MIGAQVADALLNATVDGQPPNLIVLQIGRPDAGAFFRIRFGKSLSEREVLEAVRQVVRETLLEAIEQGAPGASNLLQWTDSLPLAEFASPLVSAIVTRAIAEKAAKQIEARLGETQGPGP